MQELADIIYPHAEQIVIVMDNLNTHTPSSFYETAPTRPKFARKSPAVHIPLS